MDYSDVQLINQNLTLVTAAEVVGLERQLGTKMPPGYQEFVTTLGLGVLNDTVRVYTPARILRELQNFRQRLNEYWLWEAARQVLSKEKAVESIIVADTGNGDEIIFHPSQPDKLFILLHDSSQIVEPGSDLDAAIEWILRSSDLFDDDDDDNFVPRPEGLYFEPFPPEEVTGATNFS